MGLKEIKKERVNKSDYYPPVSLPARKIEIDNGPFWWERQAKEISPIAFYQAPIQDIEKKLFETFSFFKENELGSCLLDFMLGEFDHIRGNGSVADKAVKDLIGLAKKKSHSWMQVKPLWKSPCGEKKEKREREVPFEVAKDFTFSILLMEQERIKK